jgi:LPXTG-motif cell wall-anchored protein
VDVVFVLSGARATVGVVNRFLTVAAGALGASLALLLAAPAAHADAVDDAVDQLRSASVYVAPGVTAPKIDVDAVTTAIGSRPIKIAVLPADDYGSRPKAFEASERIGKALAPDSPLTVGVVAGSNFNASSSQYCAGSASAVAADSVETHRTELQQSNDVTTTIESFVTGLQSRPVSGSSACRGSSAAGASDASDNTGGSGAVPWVLGGIGVVGAGGVGAWVLSRRRRKQKELEGRRAEVLSLYDRLGADVSNLHGGDDPVVRQALADASERYTATGSQLSQADTHEEYDVARRTALEGLQAARTARTKLGLDPGPELPPIAPAYGEQLSRPQEVNVAGKSYQGYPEYTPGAPYYYGGGGGYPGGWYSFPFWETVLLGSVLSGGFGGGFGGWGGGGYDAGYDRGYEAGQDSGQDSGADGGGGDWGGSGWSGGGGDWGGGGGGFGGGDWGGGGGDSGGGSW